MESKDISVEELKIEIKKEVVRDMKKYLELELLPIKEYIKKEKKYFGMSFLD